jgi:voltage-gated potassium channel
MEPSYAPWRNSIHEVIFEADTKAGKTFDVLLLVLIILSIVLVMLESVEEYALHYGHYFAALEWILTIFFTIEYVLRLICVYKPSKYAFSFFGIVDLVSILPNYIGLLLGSTPYFATIRALRLIRIFRVFKLAQFLNEGDNIVAALRASRPKIIVSLMYLIEGGQSSGFTSIPRSIYWAIVTLTTVGYGDIAPTTPVGQFIAAVVMILGYAVLAVPTGIVSAEIANTNKNVKIVTTQACKGCLKEGHDIDATHCKYCGEML